MGDWLNYEAADFLLFSAEVYWRLFELENTALWPLPAIAPRRFFFRITFKVSRMAPVGT